MKKIWRAVIIGILAAIFLFGILFILGWEESKSENSSGNNSIFDAAIHGWDILDSQGNDLSENEPFIEEDNGSVQCGYQWAAMPLPEVSLEIQDAFKESGLS